MREEATKKKELTREDLAQYIETMPDSVFLRLPDAGKYLRAKAAETVRKNGEGHTHRTTFRSGMGSVFLWHEQEQGNNFWAQLAMAMPDDRGSDIPDPSPVFPTLKAGQKVLLKTLEELAATPGATRYDQQITCSHGRQEFVNQMYPIAGTIVTLDRCNTCGELVERNSDRKWHIEPWMVKAVVPDTPYISSADDPRVPSLIGKNVYCSNSVEGVMRDDCGKAILNRASTGDETRWPFVLGPFNSILAYIREIPEGKEEKTAEATIEVTMADVCKAFGKNVKIKKE